MPSRSPTRQITDCGIWLQTLPALPHHPQTQIEQGALCSLHRYAKRSTRAVRFWNICPADRRRFVATRLDAIQEFAVGPPCIELGVEDLVASLLRKGVVHAECFPRYWTTVSPCPSRRIPIVPDNATL